MGLNITKSLRDVYDLIFGYEPEGKLNTKEGIEQSYKYWRMRIFIAMYVGYVFFYFTRKSFYIFKSILLQDLTYTKAEVGLIATSLYITYGVSKFVGGVMSDRSNPRYFMAIGLFFTGVCNIFFGLSSSIYMFVLLWALNGWFQGCGWHPITKQLTHWFSRSERGKWWSICATSHNVGGALIPILVGFLVASYNWRIAIIVPGILGILISLFLFNRMRDVPETLGLPTVEEFKNEPDEESKYKKSITIKQILMDNVLVNKRVWMLGLSYFFVYIVRTAINDWGVEFLMENRNYDFTAAVKGVFWFEVGGFFGLLAAGWGSDYFFQSRRVPIMVFCSALLMLTLPMLWYVNLGVFWDFGLFALIGALIFGPQMLVGIAAAEFVDKKAACTANGLAGTCACVGSAVAGYPVGIVLDTYGWDGMFALVFISCALLFLILYPMLKQQGSVLRVAQESV